MALHHAFKHGHKTRKGMSPTYAAWNNMISRCERPKTPAFEAYGKAGITVCEEWHVFANFLADIGERPDGRSLDRIDNSKGYEPGNCRWATPVEQSQNRSCVNRLTFQGRSLTLREWAEVTGVKRSTLAQRRYVYQWPVEKILKEIA